MLDKIDLSQIPNFANLDKRFTNQYYDPGNNYSVPYQWGTTALVYDKKECTVRTQELGGFMGSKI